MNINSTLTKDQIIADLSKFIDQCREEKDYFYNLYNVQGKFHGNDRVYLDYFNRFSACCDVLLLVQNWLQFSVLGDDPSKKLRTLDIDFLMPETDFTSSEDE
jgi:hypothetical protein